MRSRHLLILTAVAVTSVGCASIVSDKNYPVSVLSTPVGAEFHVYNEAGVEVESGVTPKTVTLKSSAGYFDGEKYRIEITKDGYDHSTFVLDSSIDGWYAGNLLFGGLIGLLIVDPLTGAMFSLPDQASVNLIQQAVTINVDNKVLHLVSLESVPSNLRKDLLPLHPAS